MNGEHINYYAPTKYMIRAFIVLWIFRSKHQGKGNTSEGRENQKTRKKSSKDASDDELLTSLLVYAFFCLFFLSFT